MSSGIKVLYIGPCSYGSTSRMRCDYLKEILNPGCFHICDTEIPIKSTNRIFRSFGWRYARGPLVTNINRFIQQATLEAHFYDLIWIDKGVFIKPGVLQSLRSNCYKLVHYTPDTAFAFNRSRLFLDGISLYDHCVTTKSFEIPDYRKLGVEPIFCFQGYDPKIHLPYVKVEEKRGVVFIGHCEESRESTLASIVEAGIQLKLAGANWTKFYNRYKYRSNLVYKGSGLFGVDYGRELSSAAIGLGLLSKWFPELHTTRTFEIPACGTALATEWNPEISDVFAPDEVIYYSDSKDLISAIQSVSADLSQLKSYSTRGYKKVQDLSLDYQSILKRILDEIFDNLKVR